MTGTPTKSPSRRKKRQPSSVRHQHQHDHSSGTGLPGCCRHRQVAVLDPRPCVSCGTLLDGLPDVFWLRTSGELDEVVPVLWSCPCGHPEVLVAAEIVA